MKKFLASFAFIFTSRFMATAQEREVEMADMMHSNGKIYVVVAVLLLILSGLIIYLIRIDRRITNLEKHQNHQ